ncbi:diheme cytochrome c [Thauera sinica]|uniref:Diheme cytochrome c n=1 Tax=Thauera sinica TaxID=2665146 RepID=A0ABW1AVI7_9RHOO|nr:diheme cytochrome c [Thauera sp. K11]ATE61622.1 cytochrome C [Thauera sp. K11]
MNLPLRPLAVLLAALAAAAALLGRAQAGDDEYFPPVSDALALQECGSCHLAFPPSMLPAASWKRMMGGLQDHFGDDASLDPDTAAAITRYLVRNAGDAPGQDSRLLRGLKPGEAPLRITELPKWVREHREVPRRDWTRKDVGSKANCAACHVDAAKGYFEDD